MLPTTRPERWLIRTLCPEIRSAPIAALRLHVLLAAVQFALCLAIATCCGVFDRETMASYAREHGLKDEYSVATQAVSQYWGHLGGAGFILALGIFGMLKPVRARTVSAVRAMQRQRRRELEQVHDRGERSSACCGSCFGDGGLCALLRRCTNGSGWPEDSWQSLAVLEGKAYIIFGVGYNVRLVV